MDRHFLELWGKLLIQAAKGQQQIDDLAAWLSQGQQGADNLSEMFTKAYGLDGAKKDSPEYLKTWKKASEDFAKSLQDWMKSMKMVPAQEHQALVEKYRALEKKAAAQEDTIHQLQMLLEEKGLTSHGQVKIFQDLMQNQADEFQKMMAGIGKALGQDPNDS